MCNNSRFVGNPEVHPEMLLWEVMTRAQSVCDPGTMALEDGVYSGRQQRISSSLASSEPLWKILYPI